MSMPEAEVGELSRPSEPVMPSGVRLALAIWTWIDMTLMSILGFVVVGSFALLVWPFDVWPIKKGRRMIGRGIRLVAIVIVKLNPLWNFSVHGPIPKVIPRKTVCVSNHCSHTDPFLISHLPWEMKWLAKSGLFRIPFVGWGMWLAGDVAVVRGSAHSARAAMKRCADYLELDMPVMIFPEGTRATGSELLPFKDGAFRLAIETGADLLPMAVAGTSTALRKHDWKAHYSRGVVSVGTPISTAGMTLADLPRLKAAAREQILALRETLRGLATS